MQSMSRRSALRSAIAVALAPTVGSLVLPPLGVDGATPIPHHPQTVMLGVGRLDGRTWVVEDPVEVRKVLHVSLTFDHRVCDGGTRSRLPPPRHRRLTAFQGPEPGR